MKVTVTGQFTESEAVVYLIWSRIHLKFVQVSLTLSRYLEHEVSEVMKFGGDDTSVGSLPFPHRASGWDILARDQELWLLRACSDVGLKTSSYSNLDSDTY